ncbi:hypothetical protein PHISP_03742 [Aspergillus sp. HF37]|nr:hypothetical protein PHISP_03742 [Aspergillus sp. HF37]
MPPTPTPAACEFSPCKTGPNSDPRKVISHIFGRNKTVTKRFPPHVWVHYCRQHYQRARYRARDWAVTQCQLVLVSLGRMEEWSASVSSDGETIRGFRVVLRRRVHRSLCLPAGGDGGDGRAGKRNPTSPSAQRTRKSTLRQTRSATAAAAAPTTGPAAVQQQESSSNSPPTKKKASKEASKKATTTTKNKNHRKKPTITPNPVPGWLRAETCSSRVRSFAEIRDIVGRLKDGFEGAREPEGSGSAAAEVEEKGTEEMKEDQVDRFPDIEILPVFSGLIR